MRCPADRPPGRAVRVGPPRRLRSSRQARHTTARCCRCRKTGRALGCQARRAPGWPSGTQAREAGLCAPDSFACSERIAQGVPPRPSTAAVRRKGESAVAPSARAGPRRCRGRSILPQARALGNPPAD
eukprot:7389550-Prymnesium_polylepis.1